jgi:drug/metabolite transporter (DMT)-like permease
LAISSGSILIKFTHGVPPVMIATYRLTLSALILILITKLKGIALDKLKGKEWFFCFLSGFFLAMHFVTWISSLNYTSVASSVVLVTTSPIFVGILSFLLLKEKQNAYLIAGIILSVTGSVILTLGDSGINGFQIENKDAFIGDMLALTGGLMVSLYLLIGSKLRNNINLMTYIVFVYGFAALILIMISLVLRLKFTGYPSDSYIYMLLLAILPQLLGHTSYNWALKHLKSSMVAIASMGEPIGATVLAYFLLNETLSLTQFIGILLIFVSIVIASKKGEK